MTPALEAPVSHRGLETVLRKLAVDRKLRHAFLQRPLDSLLSLAARGVLFSDLELFAFADQIPRG
jgi:hypothetical protein